MIKVFDIFTEEEIDRFSNLRSGTITSVAISSDDRYIIYGCENKSVKIVDYKTKQQVHLFKKAHKGKNSFGSKIYSQNFGKIVFQRLH